MDILVKPKCRSLDKSCSRPRKIPSRAPPETFSHSENFGVLCSVLLNLPGLADGKDLSCTLCCLSVLNSEHPRKRRYNKSKLHRMLPKIQADCPADDTRRCHRVYDMQEIHRKIEAAVLNLGDQKIIDVQHKPQAKKLAAARPNCFLSLTAHQHQANREEDDMQSQDSEASLSRQGDFSLISEGRMELICQNARSDPSHASVLSQLFDGESKQEGSDSKQSAGLLAREKWTRDAWTNFIASDGICHQQDTSCALDLEFSWLGKRGEVEQQDLPHHNFSEDFSGYPQPDEFPNHPNSFEKSNEDQATTLCSDIRVQTHLASAL